MVRDALQSNNLTSLMGDPGDLPEGTEPFEKGFCPALTSQCHTQWLSLGSRKMLAELNQTF